MKFFLLNCFYGMKAIPINFDIAGAVVL